MERNPAEGGEVRVRVMDRGVLMAIATLSVLITTADRVLFTGKAQSMVCPGEEGTFEILPLHRALISRLGPGELEVDRRVLAIQRGIVRVANDVVTMVVELP